MRAITLALLGLCLALVAYGAPAARKFRGSTKVKQLKVASVRNTDGVASAYSGQLSFDNGLYQRVDGDSDSFYYFEAIQFSPETSGTYTFSSSSDLDLVGYLYMENFDPALPMKNLMTEDDDSADESLQFKVEAYLTAGRTYILVVTTHGETVVGSFSIQADGLSSISFERITPEPSQPIVVPQDEAKTKTNFAGALKLESGWFQRLDGDPDSIYHYEAIQITVHTSGEYEFTSDSDHDLVGYLYKDNFDPSVPSENIMTEDDDSGDIHLQFKVESFLEAGHTYILVVTTHGGTETCDFSVEASGPDSVVLQQITPITSKPLVLPSGGAEEVKSSYSSALREDAGLFQRIDGDEDSFYHYEAIQITVETSGNYEFVSESSQDLVGYFYMDKFDPSVPTDDLLTEDDDGGYSHLQFKIEAYLEAGRTYILVVTTHAASETADFSIEASGPGSVSLLHVVPSTSRPISSPMNVVSSYSSELTAESLVFRRLDGEVGTEYHYHAMEINVPTSGNYEFTSTSELDTIGYLYADTFDPTNPTENLISEDDDSSPENLQFRLKDYLQEGHKYILVLTTHQPSAVGSFSITFKGPADVAFKTIA